jgi:hypothetical protein
MRVLIADTAAAAEGGLRREYTLDQLLPDGFSGGDLG